MAHGGARDGKVLGKKRAWRAGWQAAPGYDWPAPPLLPPLRDLFPNLCRAVLSWIGALCSRQQDLLGRGAVTVRLRATRVHRGRGGGRGTVAGFAVEPRGTSVSAGLTRCEPQVLPIFPGRRGERGVVRILGAWLGRMRMKRSLCFCSPGSAEDQGPRSPESQVWPACARQLRA